MGREGAEGAFFTQCRGLDVSLNRTPQGIACEHIHRQGSTAF